MTKRAGRVSPSPLLARALAPAVATVRSPFVRLSNPMPPSVRPPAESADHPPALWRSPPAAFARRSNPPGMIASSAPALLVREALLHVFLLLRRECRAGPEPVQRSPRPSALETGCTPGTPN